MESKYRHRHISCQTKYITNHALDEHSRSPLCTKFAWDTGAHCRARFEIIWTKELAEAETASHAVDSILSSPDVREIESLTDDQTSTRKLVRNSVVERAGGAAPQPTHGCVAGSKASTTAKVPCLASGTSLLSFSLFMGPVVKFHSAGTSLMTIFGVFPSDGPFLYGILA